MTNLYKYLACFFAILAVVMILMYSFTKNKLERTENENITLRANVNNYKTQLEKEHNDKVELDRKYKKLEDKAKADKSFNWYADISNSPVILELHD